MSSRINVIEIDGRKIELFFSTWAMLKVEELAGGDLSKLGEYLDNENLGTAKVMERMSRILAVLANAAIIKRNTDIALGLEEGEKCLQYPEDYFVLTANAGDITRYQKEIYTTLNMGMGYVVPDGVEVAERDLDLEELEREKNQERRTAT